MHQPSGGSPQIVLPKQEAAAAPATFTPEETDLAEQKRRAGISESKKAATNTLSGGSGSDTTILKKNILGN